MHRRIAAGRGLRTRAGAAAGAVMLGAGGARAAQAAPPGIEPAPPAPDRLTIGLGLAGASLRGPELAALAPRPAATAAGRPAAPTRPSGLPWSSGASCGLPELAAWRGRKLDAQVQF